ncbi:hypothetical protein [Bacillus cereus]|uniref:hypothetical protein n=1 Tax=Bacillus cereus TaxID=1396 RepID=UPI000BEC0598|nr:hypothetical protein [Bacillus cereus]PEC81948.1 hypothetical protein CON28_28990 [Bacillus cereus]
MTHWYEYSIGAVHLKNAKDSVAKMQEVTSKEIGFNYGIEEEEIFLNNTRYGVLALYSINAALETIVAITSKNLGIKKRSFHDRVNILVQQGIITKNVTLQSLKGLRRKRNLITHWEENPSELLGTSFYMPLMFAKIVPRNKIEELISLFIPEHMNTYIDDLIDLLNDIMCNINKGKYEGLYYSLKQIEEESLVVGY